MAKIPTYTAKCKRCESPVLYYAVPLMLESFRWSNDDDGQEVKLVDVECTGEDTGIKHTCTYTFPQDFK